MQPDDNQYWDKLDRCDGCGNYFPKTQLKICKRCGAILCPSCQKQHVCPSKKIPRKKFVITGLIVLLFLLAGTVVLFSIDTSDGSLKLNPNTVLDKATNGEFTSQMNSLITYFNTLKLKWDAIEQKSDANLNQPEQSLQTDPSVNPQTDKPNTQDSPKPTPVETSAPQKDINETKTVETIAETEKTIPTETITPPKNNLKSDPHIVLDNSVTGEVNATIIFEVGAGITESVTAKTDAQIYFGAKLPQSLKIISRDYWVMMTEDATQDTFYYSLITQFNEIKQRREFTNDQYVEMVTSFVQTIPFDAVADEIPQYPVVTAIDKEGDCDEKSMLLAGILSRAGYDVALLLFVNEKHMTVGIKTTDENGNDDGYAVIETTYEGWYVSETDQTSNAEVYPIGTGTKKYSSASQVDAIVQYFNILNKNWDSMEKEVDSSLNKANSIHAIYQELDSKRTSVNTQMEELNQQYSSGSISYETYKSERDILDSRYEALTQQMDTIWNQYADQFSAYSNIVDSQNNWVDIYNTLADAKVCDRAKMYDYIMTHPLPI